MLFLFNTAKRTFQKCTTVRKYHIRIDSPSFAFNHSPICELNIISMSIVHDEMQLSYRQHFSFPEIFIKFEIRILFQNSPPGLR